MRGVGAAVAAVEEFPVRALDGGAFEPAKSDACLAHAAALLADVLAPRVRQPAKEILEVGVALVLPVELHRAAHEEPFAGEEGGVLVACEEDVQRRGLARELERR